MNSACCCERMNLAVYLMQNQVFCNLCWNSAASLCTAVFYRLLMNSWHRINVEVTAQFLSTTASCIIALHAQHFDLVVISLWFIIALVLLLNTIQSRFTHTQKPLLSYTFENEVQFIKISYKWQNKRNTYTKTLNSPNSIYEFSAIYLQR